MCDECETTAYLLLRQYSDELHVAASLAGGHSMVHRSEVGTVYLQIPLTIFGDSLSYMESSNTHNDDSCIMHMFPDRHAGKGGVWNV